MHGKIRVGMVVIGAVLVVALTKGWITVPEDWRLNNSKPAQTTAKAPDSMPAPKRSCANDKLPQNAKVAMTLRYATEPYSLEGEDMATKLGTDSYRATAYPNVRVGLRLDWSRSGGNILVNFGSDSVFIVDEGVGCIERVAPKERFGWVYLNEAATVKIYTAP